VTSHISNKGQVMMCDYSLYANAHIHQSPQVDLCSDEASAFAGVCAGSPTGSRGGRRAFLSFRDYGEWESVIIRSVGEGFSPKERLLCRRKGGFLTSPSGSGIFPVWSERDIRQSERLSLSPR
jgi:hypothetical protein